MPAEYPILEFDSTREALIEPSRVIRPLDVPEHCVICFFRDVIDRVCGEGRARVLVANAWEDGPHPLYEIAVQGRRLAVVHPGVGAPLAAGILEEVIAFGCRKFVACGGCGVLNKEIAVGHLILPVCAVRDEGASYHYLPPGREVAAHPDAVAAVERALAGHGVPYLKGKTWTTDAPYRETLAKIRQRQAEGCLSVEMEVAAFFAVAQFRGVPFAQVLYGGDDVSGGDWENRDWQRQGLVREKLFRLAAEACLLI
jgi:uridine phosphorylase